jgi:hypothetical protein
MGFHRAQGPSLEAAGGHHRQGGRHRWGGEHQHLAHPEVEGVPQVFLRDFPQLLEPAE